MSEHEQTMAVLREIAAVLERIEAKIGQGPAVQAGAFRLVLGISEVAKRLGTRYETARELVESGRIPGYRENGRWHVPQESVNQYLSTRLDGAA